MLFHFFFCYYCLQEISCLIPDAQKDVREEPVVGSLRENFESLAFDTSSQGSNPFKDEKIQSQHVGPVKTSSSQSVVSLTNIRNCFGDGNSGGNMAVEGIVGSLGASSSTSFNPLKDDLAQPQKIKAEKESRFQDMSRKWRERSAEVQSLKQDCIELSKLITELQRRFALLKQAQAESILVEAITKFSASMNILEEANHAIVQFKQVRLAQLGGVDLRNSNEKLFSVLLSQNPEGPETKSESYQHLSHDLLEKIVKDASMNFGDTMVKAIMREVVAIDVPSTASSKSSISKSSFILQKTGLKMVDFLIKNNFARPESVREIFQEFDMVANVVKYTKHAYYLDCDRVTLTPLEFSFHITENWYWKFLHNSFQVLGEKEEIKINFYYLLSSLKHYLLHKQNSGSPEWLYLHDSFLIDRLRQKLGMITKRNSNRRTGKKQDNIEDFQEDYHRIIDLIMFYCDSPDQAQFLKVTLLFTLLKLMEKFLSPGLLENVIQNYPRSQEVEVRFQLLTYVIKIEDSRNSVHSYFDLYPDLFRMNSIAVKHKQSIYIDTLAEVEKMMVEVQRIFKTKSIYLGPLLSIAIYKDDDTFFQSLQTISKMKNIDFSPMENR